MTKPHMPTENQNSNVTTHKRHQKLYTTIADRLRTVRWGNDSHPTGVNQGPNHLNTLTSLHHLAQKYILSEAKSSVIINTYVKVIMLKTSKLNEEK